MNVIKLALLIFISSPIFAQAAATEIWKVATLEWPPFVCSKCPENGAAAKALRDVMLKEGVEVQFVFHSWTTTLNVARGSDYVGYYPAWLEEIRPTFIGSKILFTSPVGFIEPRGKPLRWNKLADLKGKVIGTTKDYGNTEEFNRLVAEGVIQTEVVESDDTNMRKVALGRIDGALLDINNAKYFLSLSLKNISGRLNINQKILEDKALYMAFNSHHVSQAERFAQVMQSRDFQKNVDEYLKKYIRH